jgi:hypothetical protein
MRLHLLLRIVGAFWKHCIGSRITDNTQATKLTSLLHNKLRMYVVPMKTNSKQEIKDRAKNISLTGKETVRVAEHFEDCVNVVLNKWTVHRGWCIAHPSFVVGREARMTKTPR